MGRKDCSMLVTDYGRWVDTEPSRELERIWNGMQPKNRQRKRQAVDLDG